ncbi:hypothetical protein CFIO01_04394 [Colletotrichum fioriniae PJ7]|uniref:Uncharacterized protein n=1 Tax=Colletotrichum fioriniae PJ7 TaxID=1445577 RepID=A0A010RXT8_9PEZI|nr:hypothetical protein CFIO01_04394 [Colletotrichum fioriniae PJ7]
MTQSPTLRSRSTLRAALPCRAALGFAASNAAAPPPDGPARRCCCFTVQSFSGVIHPQENPQPFTAYLSAAYRCRHHGNSPRRRLHHLTSEPRHRAPVREVRVFIALPLPLNCKQTKAPLHAIQHPANQEQTALQLIMSPNSGDRLDMETPP